MQRLHVLLLTALLATTAWARNPEDRERRQFNLGLDRSYSSNNYRPGATNLETPISKACDPPEVAGAQRIRCTYSGCRVTCLPGHKLPSNFGSVTMMCVHSTGTFTVDGQPFDHTNLACRPWCSDGCQNDGECVAPGQCRCPAGFTGNRCQVEGGGCPEPHFPLSHAGLSWTPHNLTVSCQPGYAFPIGGTSATIQCRGGQWDHPPGIFAPNGALLCVASCHCLNGGQCLEGGMCDCPRGFWGQRCQLQRCSIPRRNMANSSLGGTLSRLKIECHVGYKMQSGRHWVTMHCRNGQWHLPNSGGLLSENDVKCYRESRK